MDASETIAHFADMGVLDKVLYDHNNKPTVILGKAGDMGFALRCMKDFEGTSHYYVGRYSIDAKTTDDIHIKLEYY